MIFPAFFLSKNIVNLSIFTGFFTILSKFMAHPLAHFNPDRGESIPTEERGIACLGVGAGIPR